MRELLILMSLSGFLVSSASAQQLIPLLKKEFLDSTFAVLPSEAGARYRRETEYTSADSMAGVVRVYFLNGKLQRVGQYSNLRKGVPNGVQEAWFDNGQLARSSEFSGGRRVGELRTYYKSGQLKRREIYNAHDDFKTSGECFGPDGQLIPFYKSEQMPVYPEGDGSSRAVIDAISRNVKFPRDALKARKLGRVLVSFTVSYSGEVAYIKLVEGVYASIDEAVLYAVRKLKRFKPGMQDGEPVAVSFTVPITFSIQ